MYLDKLFFFFSFFFFWTMQEEIFVAFFSFFSGFGLQLHMKHKRNFASSMLFDRLYFLVNEAKLTT